MNLNFSYDAQKDILTVEGIHYSGELFRNFGIKPTGVLLKIIARGDGVITIQEIAEEAA